MHITYGLHTPPSTPPPQVHQQALRIPPTPESRLGIFLGRSLELKGILGTGAYGVVYSAIDHSTQTWYAVKALSKFNPNGEPLDRRQREFQYREIQLHYAASAHPNVVSMLKIVDDPACTYVVLEYCPEGDLFSNITERGRYVGNDGLIRQAFIQILNAVEHCHRLGIYHRDLKPENILVSHSGGQVLLADFGLATTDPLSDDHGCGSTFYMSPECLDQSSRHASYRCAPNDIWSLGVILVNLICGRNPWKQASTEDATYKAFTRDRKFLKTILPLSDELNEILGMIFERNPKDRITVSELKRRIIECPSFSSPPQQLFAPSPPSSPWSVAADEHESLSDDGSVFSDSGSLTSSCTSLSDPDDSDYDSPPEFPPEPKAQHTQLSLVPANDRAATNAPHYAQRPAPPAPFIPAYVLPTQECPVNSWGASPAVSKPSPWMPSPQWGHPYEHQFEHVHSAPAGYPQAAIYSPQAQHQQYMGPFHGW
ncbi:uncharacterized protein L3040_003044 [Drepanopeziza brunnea f. sp. 'multigermtubi']|uniref:Autophagy-related protein 1 n=1 Tax=Marssonina brunnea f. sp. multigermtubi (strain MB_m1) TaxID=1072389 RepID=K1WX27_MARBU|nr:Ran1-like protein kinase [Drepanopeziza brunnea f. sp. 'multigermtubi' MB_m1]EKD13243.1 Ran1-like protein kinase [Drepanopeziza brunnea f. sp. 'multigermtubi' MB_m1]KAJ5047203.1 hypothetical protein L3040_003044 [Drepanopeziza brunnea f. sp. 'multigermtubi']